MRSGGGTPTFPRSREVQSCGMTNNKVVPFPKPLAPEPAPLAEKHQRIVMRFGGQRVAAFDFHTKITKLNPEPAPLIPVDRGKPKKRRKPRKAHK